MNRAINIYGIVFLTIMVVITLSMLMGLIEWYDFLAASIVWLFIYFLGLYGIKLVKDETEAE